MNGINLIYVCEAPLFAGGVGSISHQMFRYFSGRNMTVRAICPNDGNGPTPRATDPKGHPGVAISWLERPHRPTGWMAEPPGYLEWHAQAFVTRAQELFETERPDLLFVQWEQLLPGLPDLAKRNHVPCLASVHGGMRYHVEMRTGDQRVEEWVRECNKADLVTGCAEHEAETLRQIGIDEVTVVPNGVDAVRLSPGPRPTATAARLRISPSDIVAVHASTMKPVKRPLDIVAAAAIALPREPRLLFLILGDGGQRAEMEAEARRLGVANRFRFPGWIDNDRLEEYLRLAHLAVLPSQSEGMALAALEAMACECPLVAADNKAARELVDDGRDGLLFPVGDEAAFADRILRVVGDRDLRRRMGAAARKKIVTRYALAIIERQWDDVIARLVAPAASPDAAMRSAVRSAQRLLQ